MRIYFLSYKGKVYKQCTSDDNLDTWCATSVAWDGEMVEWEFCANTETCHNFWCQTYK